MMKSPLLNVRSCLAIFCLFACDNLSAAIMTQLKPSSSDQTDREKKSKETPLSCPRSSNLSTAGKYDLFVYGEFLYWKPSEGGMDYALPTSIGSTIPGKTSPHSISFKWEPGFRIGAGYHLPYDGWKTSLSASYLHSDITEQRSGLLFPSQALQNSNQVLANPFTYGTSARANWKLTYWDFDFRVGREQSMRKSFLWVPYCGLRGAMIHQQFHTNYYGVVADAFTGNLSVATTNEFNGVGLQVGVNAEWILGKGFRFLGNFSNALVYGWYELKQDQVGILGQNVLEFSNDLQRISPMVDLMIALSWGTFFQQRHMHLEFHAGYQMQYWWRQNQMPRFIDSQSPYYVNASEDLSFQGLTLGTSFEF